MKVNYNGMKIYVKESYEEMSLKAARMIAAQLILKNESVLGLATGSTPEGMYKHLIKMYREGMIDFSEAITFNLDEYYHLEASNDQSYAYYMQHNLFQHVNMKEKNINIPNGMIEDIKGLCADYDAKIQDYNNMDIQILGIGTNGHIGFNEPDIKFEAGTHLVKLDNETIEANSRFFDSIEDVPREALSMGIRNIMHSKKIVLLANGKSKAEVLRKMITGPVTPNVPASILQLHNDVTLILDREAASQILELL